MDLQRSEYVLAFNLPSTLILITSEAMTRMRYSTNPNDRLNHLSTYGALFFGVPSRGMNVEALASMVLKTPARFTLNLLDQQLGYSLREKLHAEFCRTFDYSDSKIVQFYELGKSPTVIQVRSCAFRVQCSIFIGCCNGRMVSKRSFGITCKSRVSSLWTIMGDW